MQFPAEQMQAATLRVGLIRKAVSQQYKGT
jgi:hypothetical protein